MSFFAFIFDVETTGLLNSRLVPLKRLPFVTEFYGALVDLDAPIPADATSIPVLWELDTLLNPGVPISEEITRITGIDDAMVRDAPTFSQFRPLLTQALLTVQGMGGVAIAHNASFDVEMLEIEYERDGVIVPWPRVVCTVEQTIHISGHRLNLQALHELLFGEKFREAHRARNDVTALIRCCVELRRRGDL